jgi:4-amino-4-deoxychorismate lyase
MPTTPPPVLVMIDRAAAGGPPLAEGETGWRVVESSAHTVHVTDLGVTRGDGIFEGLGVSHGSIQALEPHLARLARSAALLDLPELDLDVIRAACLESARLHEPAPLLLQKLVVTRGVEGGDGSPTAWVRTELMPDHDAEREHGIRLVSLDRGYRHDVAQTSPWLLQGAKTLSYAVNKSVLREAARRGADDVIFVSSDGYALEGPSASLIARFGDRFVTPSTDQGILEGTTQAAVFETLEALGHETAYELLPMESVRAADALWLASSGRQISPISSLDGVPVAFDRDFSQDLADAMEARRD